MLRNIFSVSLQSFEIVIETGINLNLFDDEKQTALYGLLKMDFIDNNLFFVREEDRIVHIEQIIKLLIKNGADLNSCNYRGETILDKLLLFNPSEIVKDYETLFFDDVEKYDDIHFNDATKNTSEIIKGIVTVLFNNGAIYNDIHFNDATKNYELYEYISSYRIRNIKPVIRLEKK